MMAGLSQFGLVVTSNNEHQILGLPKSVSFQRAGSGSRAIFDPALHRESGLQALNILISWSVYSAC